MEDVVHPGSVAPPARGHDDALSQRDLEHLMMLRHVEATANRPAFGVDFGEMSYRVLGGLVRRGFVAKARAYRYGENRTRTGYWVTRAGVQAMDGSASIGVAPQVDGARSREESSPPDQTGAG